MTECLEIFQDIWDQNGEDFILDTYIPTDGTYVIVQEIEDTMQMKNPAVLKYDKKQREMQGKTHVDYYDLKFYDYYSKLVDMNKPIDTGKIIQSNNYLSFFIKKESLTNGKLKQSTVDGYYDVLLHPEHKYDKAKPKQIYKIAEETLMPIDEERLMKAKIWIEKNIFSLKELNVPLEGKDYLKIFFVFEDDNEKTKKLFRNEGNRYFIPNIFNNNDFNQTVSEIIWGVPNDNMGLNAKKPYLEHKTRGNSVPYLLDTEKVLLQKLFFDYLLNLVSEGKVNIYIDFEKRIIKGYPNGEMPRDETQGLFLRLQKGKEVEIHSADRVAGFKPNLSKEFVYKNVLEFDWNTVNSAIPFYGSIKTLHNMQEIINDVFFSKKLITNYFTKPEDISINEGYLKKNVLLARERLFNWFYKGDAQGIKYLLHQISLAIIKGSISNGYAKKAIHQFNLRVSLIDYFRGGEDTMEHAITDLKEELRKKINRKDTIDFEKDDEFYFAIGQAVYFFISLNKSGKKTHSLANPFFNAKNSTQLKDKLQKLFIKYNYTIDFNGLRFENLFAMILAYKPNEKINQDMMVAGYLSNNLIYEKLKEEQ